MKTVIRPETEMKDSGIEWIGDIPKDWNSAPIKVNFDIYAGATPSSNNPIYWDGDIAWITPADYKTEDKYVSCGKRHISQDGYDNCSAILVPANSIIFSKRAPIGTVAISKNELCTNQGCLSCVSKDDSNIEFYYYAMSIATEEFELKGSGTTFKEISLANFKNFRFAVPPLSEQQAIADYLDETCSKIDEIIAEAKASIDEYKELKQSVIFEAVTKGLDKNVEMKGSGSYWIGDIPLTWSTIKTKYVIKIENGSDPSTEGDTPVYGSGANSFKTCGEYKVGPTVLLGRKGATLHIPHYIEGKYWNVDTAFNTTSIEKRINLKYFYYVAFCFDYNRYISQTTLPGMTQTSYRNIYIPYPPMNVQNRIVLWLDNKIDELDSLITEKESLIKDLESYKKSLIYEVVTGKRRVV